MPVENDDDEKYVSESEYAFYENNKFILKDYLSRSGNIFQLNILV
jgi:hypothetical protein